MSEAQKSFTVSQYNSAVERLLRERVPATWVRGTLLNLQERGRAVYLQLADFVEGDHKPLASLDLILFRRQFEVIQERLSKETRPFQIEVGIQLCFLIEANFYVQGGRFQPQIKDIDPTYTLGELARTRAAILKRLKEEGLYDANRSLPFPQAPLRIGMITSIGSAAEQDFRTTLANSPYAVEIIAHDARMQGPETEKQVVNAIEHLNQEALDCVVIIRGGGSKSDLVWFDSEEICRAIARSSHPVLTGIGHEIDRSLADEVAWSDRITPTDTARFILEKLDQAMEQVEEGEETLREGWRERCREEKERLLRSAELLRRSSQLRRELEEQESHSLKTALRSSLKRRIERERERLSTDAHGLERGTHKITEREAALIAAHQQLIRAVDPKRLLEKGFSLIRRAKTGELVRFEQIELNDELSVEMSRGAVAVKVQRLEKRGVQSIFPKGEKDE